MALGSYALTVNGKSAVAQPEDGFVYLMVNAGDTLELDMSVKFVRANSRVRSDAGQVAVMRGLLVYCVEQADNPGDLWNYRLADGVDAAAAKTEFQSDLLGSVDTSRCRLCVSRLIAMTPRYMRPPTLRQPLKQPY